MPAPHPDPWVNLLRDYVTEAVRVLEDHDFQVQRSWLDPSGPRDATILYVPESASPHAPRGLVWDEETGWRTGVFASGEQGVRTQLDDIAFLGGGALPDPTELARRVVRGTAAPRREYRSHTHLRDGLDDALRNVESAR